MSVDSSNHSLLIKVLQIRGTIDMPATGTSMFPFIREGEVCRFVSMDRENVKRGDILLYQSNQGQLIAHRLIHKAGDLYQCKGDSNLGNDDWVSSGQLIGKMVYVSKNHKIIHLNGLIGKAWAWFILTFPLISKVLRRFLLLKTYQKVKR